MGTADVGVGRFPFIFELIYDASPRTAGDRMATFSIALLLFCFGISNPSTRIFVAVTSVMVAALIGWCIRSAWESSEARGAWLSSTLPSVNRALGHVRATCLKVFASIDDRPRRETSLALARVGSVRSIPDREGTGIVAV
jgi:hypothetical protein